MIHQMYWESSEIFLFRNAGFLVTDIVSTKTELQIVFCNLGNQVVAKLIFHYHVSAFE